MVTADINGGGNAWTNTYRSVIGLCMAVIIGGGGWFLTGMSAKQDRILDRFDKMSGQVQSNSSRIDVLWTNDLRYDVKLDDHDHRITVLETENAGGRRRR